jgi:hypothetical protein
VAQLAHIDVGSDEALASALEEARKIYDNAEFAEWSDCAAILMPSVVEAKRLDREEHQVGLERQRQDAEARTADLDRRMAELDASYEAGQINADEYSKGFTEIKKMRDEDVVMGDDAQDTKSEAPKPRPKPIRATTMSFKAMSPLHFLTDVELPSKRPTVSSKGPSERDELSDDEGGSVQSGEERQTKRKRVGELRAVKGPVSYSISIVPLSY